MKKIYFSVVGAGWRTKIFFRLAKELPDLFSITGVVVRNPETAKKIKEKWGFKVVEDIVGLEDAGEFTILSLPQDVLPEYIKIFNERELFILSETFEMSNTAVLNDFYQSIKNPKLVQIAEQYAFQPAHAARLKLIEQGELGGITQAIVSSGHGYHGMSLVRKYLNKTFENCKIKGKLFSDRVVRGPGRNGYPPREEIINEEQHFATLDYGESIAFYYFSFEQYFSRIRQANTLIRGTHGEISNYNVRTLLNHNTPIEYCMIREVSGINETPNEIGLIGITAAKEWCYKSKYPLVSLSDDEIAVATVIEKMAVYVRGGKPVYTLEEGLQDQYLSLMIKESFKIQGEIQTEYQSFAKH